MKSRNGVIPRKNSGGAATSVANQSRFTDKRRSPVQSFSGGGLHSQAAAMNRLSRKQDQGSIKDSVSKSLIMQNILEISKLNIIHTLMDNGV